MPLRKGSQWYIQLEIFNLTAENFKYKSHSSGSLTLPVFTIVTAYSLKTDYFLQLDNLYKCLSKQQLSQKVGLLTKLIKYQRKH